MMDEETLHLLHDKQLVIVEFVAVPETLNIDHYLSMRESTGFIETVDRKQLMIICDAVKYSSIFAVVNNLSISATTVFAFLQILDDLGLMIKVSTNPLAGKHGQYMDVAKMFIKRDQEAKGGNRNTPVSFVIVNLLMLQQEGIMDKALKNVIEVDEYFSDIADTIKKVGKFD